MLTFLAGLIISEQLPGRCGWLLLTERSWGRIPFLQGGWLNGFWCECYLFFSLVFLDFSDFLYFSCLLYIALFFSASWKSITRSTSIFLIISLCFSICSQLFSILLWCHSGWRMALGSHHFWLADVNTWQHLVVDWQHLITFWQHLTSFESNWKLLKKIWQRWTKLDSTCAG